MHFRFLSEITLTLPHEANEGKTSFFIFAQCWCPIAHLETIFLIKIERHESAGNTLYGDRSYSAANFRTQLKVINETASP